MMPWKTTIFVKILNSQNSSKFRNTESVYLPLINLHILLKERCNGFEGSDIETCKSCQTIVRPHMIEFLITETLV